MGDSNPKTSFRFGINVKILLNGDSEGFGKLDNIKKVITQ